MQHVLHGQMTEVNELRYEWNFVGNRDHNGEGWNVHLPGSNTCHVIKNYDTHRALNEKCFPGCNGSMCDSLVSCEGINLVFSSSQ